MRTVAILLLVVIAPMVAFADPTLLRCDVLRVNNQPASDSVDDDYFIVDLSRKVIAWRVAIDNIFEFVITKLDDIEIVAVEEYPPGKIMSTNTLNRRTLEMNRQAHYLTPPETVDLQCRVAPDPKL